MIDYKHQAQTYIRKYNFDIACKDKSAELDLTILLMEAEKAGYEQAVEEAKKAFKGYQE